MENSSSKIKGNLNNSEIETWRLITHLDLGPIKYKLVNDDHGHPWSLEKVSDVEVAYKRFLFISYKYKGIHVIVPSSDVDEFWHQHILDTRKYHKDCIDTFGYFLHHFPYMGMRGEEDANHLVSSFAQTQILYQIHFDINDNPSKHMISSNQTCDQCSVSGACNGSQCNTSSLDTEIRPTLAIAV